MRRLLLLLVAVALTVGGLAAPARAQLGGLDVQNLSVISPTTPLRGGMQGGTVPPVYEASTFGVVCDGRRDNSFAINTAISTITATGGGVLRLPPGTCMVGATVLMQTRVQVAGTGRYATTMKAMPALSGTADLIQTQGFSTNHGTGNNVGPFMFGISDMTIDGNKGARSGTGGRDLAFYGYDYRLTNLYVQNAPGDCIWSEWGNEASGLVPVAAGGVSFSSRWYDMDVWGCNNNGVTYNGPSDSFFTNVESFLNVAAGLAFTQAANSTAINSQLHSVHSYGNGGWGITSTTELEMDQVQTETNLGQCVTESICPGFNPTGLGGIEMISNGGASQLDGAHVFSWGNATVGLSLNDPGSTLSDVALYQNGGDGLDLNLGYNGPTTTIAGISIYNNTGTGINACVAGASGGAFLNMTGGAVWNNTAGGISNCMQNVVYTGMTLTNNGSGFNTASGSNNALIVFQGNLQGDTGTEFNLGTLVGSLNTIEGNVFTKSGAVCWSGTLNTNTVNIECTGSGTGTSVNQQSPITTPAIGVNESAPATGNVNISGQYQIGGNPLPGLVGVQSFCNGSSGCTTNSCSSGCTYTPDSGTVMVEVQVVGGGGGSGGCGSPASGNGCASFPGAAGAYADVTFTSGFSGVIVTPGAAGAAGASTPGAGGAGGTSTFGSLISCSGGSGGAAGAATSTFPKPIVPSTGQTGICTIAGGTTIINQIGAPPQSIGVVYGSASQQQVSGGGGESPLGVPGGPTVATSSSVGNPGHGFGAGASGAAAIAAAAATTGTTGAQGAVIIREYGE